MERETLLDHLTEDIFAYVMHGTFPERRFANAIKFDGLDERFNDYEMLVRLHFILQEEVVEFVSVLPERLRSIKTQTETVTATTRGSVRGRINWSDTFQERYSTDPGDRALFVCENRSESYDIDENIVLKRLLSVIYHTLDECEQYLRQEYEWVTDRWRENLELVQQMREIFERNVHVRRIRTPATYEPTPRMVMRAEDSRSEVYRDAAELVEGYHQLLAGDEAAIRSLLERTAITPDDDETLFELFVLFRYIRTLEELREGEFRLQTIETGSQEIARMEDGEAEFVLYHDTAADKRGVTFTPNDPSKPDAVLSRPEMVHRRARSVVAHYFKWGEERPVYTKRPDVIVLEIRRDEQLEYLVTEVKHSTRERTIKQGIEETLEYLAFLKQDEEFVFEADSEYFGSGWNGLLVVQDLDEDTRALGEQDEQPIRILQASEVLEELDTVVSRLLKNDG